MSPAVNGVGEDAGGGVMLGKVVRPLRSVDPTQTEYQGLIEVAEEGEWCTVCQDSPWSTSHATIHRHKSTRVWRRATLHPGGPYWGPPRWSLLGSSQVVLTGVLPGGLYWAPPRWSLLGSSHHRAQGGGVDDDTAPGAPCCQAGDLPSPCVCVGMARLT